MTAAQTHDLTFSNTEVRKRYVEWHRAEPDREWACLTMLAEYAPGVAPTPLRRETDPDGSPVIVMTRLPGDPLGDALFTPAQTESLGRALRRTFGVPDEALQDARVPERIYGPSTLPKFVTQWLSEPHDLSQCQDPNLVRRGVDAALSWLADPALLPASQLSVMGVSDRKPANVLWDGRTCRLVDFEDSGLSDPAYELADHTEHIAGRLAGLFDPMDLIAAVELSTEQRERMRGYRPLWAAFWLAMLLPGNAGFRRNPLGATETQARHLLVLTS